MVARPVHAGLGYDDVVGAALKTLDVLFVDVHERDRAKAVATCGIYCMQRAAIVACNNCRLSNVFENIHEAKVLQPMTAFGGIT